ncbi:MAG: cyclic nucleotide-binding domain-containing protein, partial [Spongiibacteraceae bacterium]|nr:cyclic nucleotide-binding domain-containing protein [Spongiibacteraceae bacterium]
IIKKGFAQVYTEPRGPLKGKVFNLTAGDYFGDEALIADTPRNASVIMSSDGTLGRIGKTAFTRIIKERLVPSFAVANINHQSELKILDVRYAAEYKNSHEVGSTNIPISYLRKKLNLLNKSCVYILTPANDKRSELATYLMRQAGFDAYQQVAEAVLNVRPGVA